MNVHLPRGTGLEDALLVMRSVAGVSDAALYG
jgi:hypothetical protein